MEHEKETVSAPRLPTDWISIDWRNVEAVVRQLRQAIFRASKEGDLKKVRTLQRIMLRSFENRADSVRRVTQKNKGKHTPGVDKQLVKTPEARARLVDQLAEYEIWKPLPTKRVYIPKANGKERPLGIPVIVDRAIQAMVKNALEPYWEAQFEDSSYGFRPGRSCHDALGRIFNLASPKGKRRWVLDADIKGAFDNIDHDKLLDVIGNFPARELIRQWLKAGYLEEGVFHDTESGTPQGGVISPLLANIAFHGMEERLSVKYIIRKGKPYGSELHPKSVGLVRYADDFVVFCHSKEEAEEVKEKLKTWFAERGLSFSEEKTRITNLDEGFDFLSFNVRQYAVRNTKSGWKLLMRPSKKSVKAIKRKMKIDFRGLRGSNTEATIRKMNPIIHGWSNYFRVGVSGATFSHLDNYLFELQRRWVGWQHPTRSWGWKKRRYWGNYRDGNMWCFGTPRRYMWKFGWTPIKRHVLVQRFASKDDPKLQDYWEKKTKRDTLRDLNMFQTGIAKKQDWVCPLCGNSLWNGDEVQEAASLARKDRTGKRAWDYMQIIHRSCQGSVKPLMPLSVA